MKRIVYIFCLFVVGCLFSCELESSDNGKLDGFWHLDRVDSLSTKGVADLSGDLLFWSVQGKMLQVSDQNSRHQAVIFRFEHSANTLVLSNPIANIREIGDSIVTNVSNFSYAGVNNLEERFQVEKLTGNKMVLVSEQLRLWFTKF